MYINFVTFCFIFSPFLFFTYHVGGSPLLNCVIEPESFSYAKHIEFFFFKYLIMSSAPNSPKNKIKLLCSHGGKILPRPADGHLKYVGGETRVISVPRDIKFHGTFLFLFAFYLSYIYIPFPI